MNDETNWNNTRGAGQGSGGHFGGRKQGGHSYSDYKGKNYSPSTSYNYSQNGRPQGQNFQQHPRRRSDRFKRETINHSDKALKQNDMIIQLLKEIRDILRGSEAIPAHESIPMDSTAGQEPDQSLLADGQEQAAADTAVDAVEDFSEGDDYVNDAYEDNTDAGDQGQG